MPILNAPVSGAYENTSRSFALITGLSLMYVYAMTGQPRPQTTERRKTARNAIFVVTPAPSPERVISDDESEDPQRHHPAAAMVANTSSATACRTDGRGSPSAFPDGTWRCVIRSSGIMLFVNRRLIPLTGGNSHFQPVFLRREGTGERVAVGTERRVREIKIEDNRLAVR